VLTTILTIFGSLLPTILQNSGVIGAGTGTLINNLTGPILSLIATLKSGTTATQDYLAALAALQAVVVVLQANKTLPAATLTELSDIDTDIAAALTAYATSANGLDLTQYKQIPLVA
jgi:hypothetical protein